MQLQRRYCGMSAGTLQYSVESTITSCEEAGKPTAHGHVVKTQRCDFGRPISLGKLQDPLGANDT